MERITVLRWEMSESGMGNADWEFSFRKHMLEEVGKRNVKKLFKGYITEVVM